ncbi:MAG TPA: ABC transporter ATP-binding protein [Solirubrobacterales bacterium]|jgi:branched-chain amino acid transport system ATP-binding protein
MSAATPPLISVRNLAVRYGAAYGIQDVSFELRPGEVIALIGANGAGKTTTLRALSGLMAPAAGSIEVRGAPLGRGPRAALAGGIAHCPEGRLVFPTMSVAENLAVGGFTVRDRAALAARSAELIELFEVLAERRDQAAGTLSGGEQQMLAMARALMTEPEVLLLDEPTMGLAPIIARQVAAVVRRLRERGTAVLLVEESSEMALELADRVYLLDGGRVVLEGTTDELVGSDLMQKLYLGAAAAPSQ